MTQTKDVIPTFCSSGSFCDPGDNSTDNRFGSSTGPHQWDLSQVLFTQFQPKMDNLATSTSALFKFQICFTAGRGTSLQDRLDVYFLKMNILGKFRQKDRKEREEGKNINNLVLSLLI